MRSIPPCPGEGKERWCPPDDRTPDEFCPPFAAPNEGVLAPTPGAPGGGCLGLNDFPVVALGNKPEYHIARDVLCGSLYRNRLASWFRNYAKRPPPWLEDRVAHLPLWDRPQAVQH